MDRRYSLVIADDDTGYVEGFANYVSSTQSNQFTISSFVEIKLLEEYLDRDKVDILLITPQLFLENERLNNPNITIILSEGRIPAELNHLPFVNKYQSGDKIMSDIINIYSELSNNEFLTVENNLSKIIGVYSPIGGIGKTTIAINMSRILASRENEVLHLNLEDIPSTEEHLICDKSNNMSDLLYHLKDENKNIMLKIEGLKQTEYTTNIHYIAPHKCIKDYEEVTLGEWSKLLNILKEKSNYKYIIIDFDSSFREMNRELLNLCHKIVLLRSNSNINTSKINNFYKNIEYLGYEEVLEKIITVANNPIPNRENVENSITTDEAKYTINHYPYVTNNVQKLLSDKGLNQLCDELESIEE